MNSDQSAAANNTTTKKPSLPSRLFSDRRCLDHQVPTRFPECPPRVESCLDDPVLAPYFSNNGVEHQGREAARDRAQTDQAIFAVHDPEYVARLQTAVENGERSIDTADNPLSPGTFEAALAAVEVGLDAVDHVSSSKTHAFALVRPPGHHCEFDRAMGFCYLNTVAIMAQYLLEQSQLDRVAILDFDVHHGNGTQHLFEDRADVLYLSVHQWPFYPGTGAAEERGKGDGLGTTLNVPLAAGSGDDEYESVFEQELLPAIEEHRSQALLVSAGFDCWRDDPLGSMQVGEAGFKKFGEILWGLARHQCGGRMVSVLEGGYDVAALPRLIASYLEGVDGS